MGAIQNSHYFIIPHFLIISFLIKFADSPNLITPIHPMPIEIRELVIRTNIVGERENASADGNVQSLEILKKEILAQCTEMIKNSQRTAKPKAKR
jgi:Family of unknown function (DUF5908)